MYSDNLKEGVLVGQRAAALFAAQGLESSVSKMMAAVIVVHLALGDVVQVSIKLSALYASCCNYSQIFRPTGCSWIILEMRPSFAVRNVN